MKQKILFPVFVIFLVICMNSSMYGQKNDEDFIPSKFGIGIHLERNKTDYFAMEYYFEPVNKIIITVNPLKYIRLEPEIGLNFSKLVEYNLKHQTISTGLGIFGMFQRGNTNFYGGLRTGYMYNKSEYLEFGTGGLKSSVAKSFSIGPAAGAEYFIGKHLSIGAEAGLSFFNLKSKEYQYAGDADINFTVTETGLLIRFYF
jgi:hypothetical protein